MFAPHSIGRRIAATTSIVLTVAMATVGVGSLPTAEADTAPPVTTPATPATAAALALPTWQIDGVVWSQTVVGNIVYVAGNFTTARPPGVAKGGAGEIPVGHLFAYDIRTGARVAGFAPVLNAQALVVKASPDGSRLYVGGDFTTVDGQARSHIAAIDLRTGKLDNDFQPSVGGQVRAIAPTNDTVYVGGSFEGAQGVARRRLAAFTAANGEMLPWAPKADDGYVWSLIVAPGGAKIIAAGAFTTISGTKASGTAALDLSTGKLLPWAMNARLPVGPNSAITNLSTDGTNVYGGGYVYSTRTPLEGTFAADPADGKLKWAADCVGDTYDTQPIKGVLYVASHAHDCSVIGGHPNSYDSAGELNRWQHSLALTTDARGKNLKKDQWGFDFTDLPAPELLQWYPQLGIGSATGQFQASWDVAGNDGYVAVGGEFPTVNGAPQQGLTRFAIGANITATKPPQFQTQPARTLTDPVATVSGASVSVKFQSAWDMDNAKLTYELVRDRGTATEAVVTSRTLATNFWTLPDQTLVDAAPKPGSHRYSVKVSDPTGNVIWSGQSNAVSASGTLSAYPTAVLRDGADHYWRLGETGPYTYDLVSGTTGTPLSGVTKGVAGALSGDTDKAMSFDGTASGRVSSNSTGAGGSMSADLWFKTTTTAGGRILTFLTTSGNNSLRERQIVLTHAGKLQFRPDGKTIPIESAKSYNTGKWVHVAATVGAGGTKLYADGDLVASDATVTTSPTVSGTWQIGAAREVIDGAVNAFPFKGTIDEVATYDRELSATQVLSHSRIGRGQAPPVNVAPKAAFTSTVKDLEASVDGSTSSDADGTVAAYSWDFGDGTPTVTGATAKHSYAKAGDYSVTLTVTDNVGATAKTTSVVKVLAAPPVNVAPKAAFTSTVKDLEASVDGSTSSDADGTVAAYSWDFGDDSPAVSGATAKHDYAKGGDYSVTLTVTDNVGATAKTTSVVKITAPQVGAIVASDAFSRTVSAGWGTADVGGEWTLSGPAVHFSVAGARGILQVAPGTGPGVELGDIAGTDNEVTMSFSGDTAVTGGGLFTTIIARGDVVNGYGARVWIDRTGAVRLYATRNEGGIGTDTGGVPAGITYEPDATYRLKVQVTGVGTTHTVAKVWRSGEPEPDAWTLDSTDSTASLQKAGGVAVAGYLSRSATSPVRVSVGAFSVRKVLTN